ncbi:MAG TPA: hypothetical protein P5571_06065 [Candidatus Krumholzibacteria bacterium]|nr:hypothetical protein [Candidatus Krumholzibacteria bacterium]HRX50906.1 hypothetical protein [Candidatus Krumholzibacteria bacterium]
MSRRHLRRCWRTAALAVLLLVAGGVNELHAAPTLKRSDFYRYRVWVDARAAQPDTAPTALFPAGEAADADGAPSLAPDRLDTAARSLITLEDMLVRNWTEARKATAEDCLDAARSYRDLGEHGAALTWYRRSAQARGLGSALPADIRREMFSSAVMTGDSLQVTVEVLNLVGLPELRPVVDTVELAFRWLVVHDGAANLDLFMQKVDGQLELLGPRVRFWAAYVHAMRGERHAALAQLLRLVGDAASPAALTPAQSDWVLRTVPDLLYLLDRRDDALRLYATLAEGRGEGAVWARYQVANQHLLAGDYERARPLFDEVCDAQAVGTWRARACALAGLVGRLAAVREGGESYGIDGIHGR